MVREGVVTAQVGVCGSSARVRVRVLAWGLSVDDVEIALEHARRGGHRAGWDFAKVDRVTWGPCLIDPGDPGVIAVDCGSGWAYAVYPADSEAGQ